MTGQRPLDAESTTTLVLGRMRMILGHPDLGPDDHFFEWGGDSILAAQVINQLNEEAGLSVATSLLFAFPTAGELGAAIAEDYQG